MGSWVLNSPQTHRNSQGEPQADPGSTDSPPHLCFPICHGVCTEVGENSSTKPKMKHPECDILIPALPLAYQ